ncbi:ABC-three component system protein [Xanthobacter sp. 126]|uniref:ABC-three component system protein n=1 Tax=Xanthobacter sp. 126 TaxID=1131814 RepID=UPI0012DF0C45|nr:ABC-three component system protein [Xanthobacter sp. 126]
MSREISKIDQSHANAAGDIVAGNKITYCASPALPPSIVERLMERLAKEIKENKTAETILDSLQFYHSKVAKDGIVGLEAKLAAANRSDELFIAYEKKELFVKILEKYSLYESAQKIFAYILAKAEHQFSISVHCKIETLDKADIDELITEKIIDPIVYECGMGPLDITHSVVMGMIYWLAEQCFIRWHL